jgi:hypothetical protein
MYTEHVYRQKRPLSGVVADRPAVVGLGRGRGG